jgi:hypothetical protein
MLKNFLRFAVALSAFLVALRVGYYLLGVAFRNYDDEGYMLLSLQHYLAGGHLYSQVFTEYGPVFFWVHSSLFRLFHLSVTHDAGRQITLLFWSLASMAAAWFLYRISRSVVIASATCLVMMLNATGMATEPDHPQHLALLVLMLARCASTFENPTGFFLLGALGAALFFIKVNIGVFLLVAVFAALCCILRSGPIRKIGGLIFILYFVAAPVALMHRDLHVWASGFCVLSVLCGALTIVTALYTAPRFASVRSTFSFAALGAVFLSVLVLIATTLQKISPRVLLEGILLNPLRHPQLYQFPLRLSLLTTLFVALVVSGILALYSLHHIRQRDLHWINHVRAVAGLYVVLALVFTDHYAIVTAVLLVPLALLPDNTNGWNASGYVPRLFIALLAATELLESYPVGGSQVAISVAPLLLWSFICIDDGARELARRFPQLNHAPGRLPAIGTLIGLALVLCLEAKTLKGSLWRMRFFTPASMLRGSHSMHLTPATERLYVTLTTSVSRNCDMLYTLPGMGSLNFWSGEPTPNGMNLTAWVRFFRPDQQQEILRILQKDPSSCVVWNPRIESKWNSLSFNASSPLARYIVNDMPRVSAVGDYQIRINPQRKRPWIGDTP